MRIGIRAIERAGRPESGFPDSILDVIHLQVEENPLPAGNEIPHELHSGREEELPSNLEEGSLS